MSKEWIIKAEVDCVGTYLVQADTEEEAVQKYKNWTGGSSVQFDGYASEYPSMDIVSIELNE